MRTLAPRYPDHLGFLTAPANGNSVASIVAMGLPFAADNGAFSGFNEARFLRLLDRLQGVPRLLWVVAPDVVADARLTLAQWPWWSALIRSRGLPVAFVGQDGQESLPVPWDEMDALFIGGSTRWKLSQASFDLCQEARRRGIWIHMGRVNSLRRLRTAHAFGADSCDGSAYSKWEAKTDKRPDMSLERHLKFVQALERDPQSSLFTEAP